MNKKYVVRPSDSERDTCQEIIKNLKGSSQKCRRAQILYKVDADGPGWSDDRVAEAFNRRIQTIENVRKRLVAEGFEAEAKLIAMRLGRPPAGYGHGTLPLLADEMAALEIVDTISHETVRQVLKKNGMTKRKIEYWVIPPDQDAEFAACMEEVLETYAAAYDPRHPVPCMDEQPVPLFKETRVPIAATKRPGRRVERV